MNTLPAAFIAAAISMILGQTWKVASPIFRGKPPAFGNTLQSGGMPSSHTAAVASMTLVTGFRDGFDSSIFAVALVLTAVVAHDAIRVRGSINTIINILKKTASPELLEKEGGLPDTVGHSAGEVAAGFLLAGLVATGCHFLLF
jgi:acid phosphatase family membrane protein YuiD